MKIIELTSSMIPTGLIEREVLREWSLFLSSRDKCDAPDKE